ncbi:MAG: DUF4190 domain-containing protein [Herbinix sp.]|nr:DUF4190 domain-containing protein [Herbinix sp.]
MDNKSDGKATASLVLGIVSLVFIFFGTFAFIGMILAIIGLVFGISAKKENPEDGKAKAGIVLCIIGLALCTISLLACAACFASLAFLPF